MINESAESRRVRALKEYQILDTPQERQYDSITRLASYVCQTPVALISFLDEERQWFKSRIGIDLTETACNISFCQYTIQNDFLLEIKDAHKDARFSSSPLVCCEPGIRYYAGAPLITPQGEHIGALCVADFKPRELDERQKETLEILAKEVVTHLEAARRNHQLQELLDKAQRFHDLFNNSNEIHCITNSEGRIEFINDSIRHLMGYCPEEVIGKTIWEFCVDGERERVMPDVYLAIADGKDRFDIETKVITKKGEERWFGWSDVIKEGYWLVNGRDITERKQAELRLKTLSMAVEKSSVGVLIRNEKNEISWVNHATELLIGYSLNELKGKTLGNLFVGRNTDRATLSYAQKAVAERKPYEKELLLYKKDGSPIWLLISTNPLFNDDGSLECQISIAVDISGRKKAEEQLIKTREDAVRLSKAKENFLSVMSHEMRTPLNAVIGITRILKEDAPLERQLEHLNILEFSSQNLLTLINDVLDFTKIETGNLQLEMVPVNIPGLVSKTIESLKFKTEEKDIALNYQIDPRIPSQVLGDSTRLYQIFINLLGNAIKFTEEGEVSLNLLVDKEDEETVNIRFKVSDTGIGIPADKLNSIFDPYTQADTDTTRKYGGTGLGLTITRKLVELYHSQIHVESEPGKGTTFSFTITFRKPSGIAGDPQEEAEESLHLAVLVVDDNAINRLLAKRVLQKWEIDTDFAENGLEAVEKIKSNDYDVILMDIHMPVMDGTDAVKEVRSLPDEKYRKLPIIALTGSALSEDQDKFLNAGMDAFVLKPFEPKVLYQKLKRFAGSRISEA